MQIGDLVESVRPKLRRLNVGFQSRFGTSDISQELAVRLIELDQNTDEECFREESKTCSKPWLSKVGKNIASKLRRYHSAAKRNVKSESELEKGVQSGTQSPCENAIFHEHSVELVIAISSLDSISRLIIDGHYSKGKSLSAIAKDLELNPRYVQRKHKQAIDELRRLIFNRKSAHQEQAHEEQAPTEQ